MERQGQLYRGAGHADRNVGSVSGVATFGWSGQDDKMVGGSEPRSRLDWCGFIATGGWFGPVWAGPSVRTIIDGTSWMGRCYPKSLPYNGPRESTIDSGPSLWLVPAVIGPDTVCMYGVRTRYGREASGYTGQTPNTGPITHTPPRHAFLIVPSQNFLAFFGSAWYTTDVP